MTKARTTMLRATLVAAASIGRAASKAFDFEVQTSEYILELPVGSECGTTNNAFVDA